MLSELDIDFSYKKHLYDEGIFAIMSLLKKCSAQKNADMKLVDSEEWDRVRFVESAVKPPVLFP